MGTRVMFYVQHLLGVGHLKRAAMIARAMVDRGLDVCIVLGGTEVPGVEFAGCSRVRLPPVKAIDESFSRLVGAHGQPIDDTFWDARAVRLQAEFEAMRPDVLLIEQFPFGRRQFRFELMPLLEVARTTQPQPQVVCSLRDILVAKQKPERHREMVNLAKTWFDHVLVHGDPRLIRLDATFPEASEIAPLIHYTGYVAAPPHPSTVLGGKAGVGEVIVSAGGGAVGASLFRTALAARTISCLADRPWRLITGPNLPDEIYDELAWEPPYGVAIERWRNDMPTLLRNGVLSISQGGYNMVLDILQARTRAVVVPFATGGQTEQSHRCRLLAERGAFIAVEPMTLSADTLAKAIDCAMDTQPKVVDIDMNGSTETARFIASLSGDNRPRRDERTDGNG